MYTYKSYIDKINSISVEEAEEIYEKMLEEIDFNDSDAKELWDDLIKNAIEYVSIRSKWLTFEREERMEKDSARTSVHNTLISSFNVLSRYLEKIGKDVSWRARIGEDRKRIGDFACYIVFIFVLNAR
ncbi:hypothetical protein HMPREF1982_03379 [Clostridiales bacterium oral taxon 876 str. F0540]|nr:hypothetical protein HMPREF1982_03379 [Clostridiales bacterium oral taxon 876 str. F0540]